MSEETKPSGKKGPGACDLGKGISESLPVLESVRPPQRAGKLPSSIVFWGSADHTHRHKRVC